MSYPRFVARRAAFAVLSAYAVVTATFFLINITLWQQLRNRIALVEFGGASQEQLERVRESFMARRNLDTPLHERYVNWLVDVTTLEWGYSFYYRQSVISVLDGRVQTTLGYVIPGVLLGVALGVLLGLFAALSKDSRFDLTARVTSYVLLGVPAFMFVIYVRYAGGAELLSVGPATLVVPSLDDRTLASLAIAMGLLAGQVRFARAASLEQTGRAFVKMLRAKGASRLLLARHVLRNAALPILSLSISEVIAVMVLYIYVIEDVLRIDGLATASLRAIQESDVALVIWTTMVIVFIGIVGNFLQDVLYGYLDPRIRAE